MNDSLVLVDFINTRMRAGMDPFTASLEGSKLRLRPILLTTLTTAAGLTPLMFETSFQAKFLIPMAVTLTFGLIFATALTLVIVPCLNLIFFDVRAAATGDAGGAVCVRHRVSIGPARRAGNVSDRSVRRGPRPDEGLATFRSTC